MLSRYPAAPLALVVALGLIPAPALAQGAPRLRAIANPSALIAADIAMSQASVARGAEEAMARSMAPGAQVALRRHEDAATLLRRKGSLGPAHPRHPDAAWIACDGSTGFTRGRWTAADGHDAGWYATVWQRERKKGTYQWRLTVAAADPALAPPPDFLVGLVADCPARVNVPPASSSPPADPKAPPPPRPLAGPLPDTAPAAAGADIANGQATDGSLAWRSTITADGHRHVSGWIWKDGAMQTVLDLDAAPLSGAGG